MMLKHFARSLTATLAIVGMLCCMSGCDAENEYNISYECFFSFDTQLHNATILRNAVNPMTTGVFAMVSCGQKNGVRTVSIQLNDGTLSEDIAITTARENYTTWVLGANNGLIVGNSSLGNGLFAFDRQCPNCISNYNLYKYPLQWTNNGHWVHCASCQRKYDLNNNGYIVEGEKGLKLIRYKANFDGTVLVVHN
ncbi:MAG: hypothetical protein J5506_00165 [Prevotella sp.]|nr:hypothetical protein [Prevotella sp.]